uniref:Secreted protein n=1 Tax=Anopheles coluzzii TaxID=1518534 RepID=A0A8W7NZK1_ANOCL
MRTALVYYVCFGAILLARGSGSGAPPQHPDAPNVNVTVAKVIGAMLADGGERDNGTVSAQQEHHADRGQRIVARKGVSNDVVVPVRSAVPEHPSTVGASGNSTAHTQANATTGTTLHESTNVDVSGTAATTIKAAHQCQRNNDPANGRG